MNAEYGLPRKAIATAITSKQELVSPQLGAPIFTEYDRDGLLLDLFGSFDGKKFSVMDVSITGTRFSVLKLVEGAHHADRTLLEDMNLWCKSEYEKEERSAESAWEEQQQNDVKEMQHDRI